MHLYQGYTAPRTGLRRVTIQIHNTVLQDVHDTIFDIQESG